MSQAFCRSQNSPPAEEDLCRSGTVSLQRIDTVICSLIEHARPTAQEISELASDKEGFGLALVLLRFVRTGRSLLPLASLDLSGFSLSARKLKLLLSSLPSGPGIVETLRCGPHVCKDGCLPVLLDFLLRLKAGVTVGVSSICLKTLNLAKCDLGERINPFFHLLPGSLEHLDLSGNRLRSVSMEGLGSVFSFGWLPCLLSLDLSDNPLGPSGLRAFARGLSSSPQSLPLQSLKLARTKAEAAGMEELADALKAKKTTSLQTLDLAENEMRPEGLKHLASAVNAEAVPDLRVLMLRNNRLAHLASGQRDYAPIAELLSTSALKELEELHLNENSLFDERLAGGGEGEGEGGEGDEGEAVQASAAALAVPGRFPRLRRLVLGGEFSFSMTSEQLAAFAKGLGVGGLPSLQELVLPWGGSVENPEGVISLANALSSGHLSQLRDLKIEHRDDMTSHAFATLSRSLATGKAPLLQSLDLQMWNENAEGGVEALAEGFRRGGLSSLTSFRLDVRDMFCTKGYALSTLGLAFGGSGGGGCPALQKLDLEWAEEGDEGEGERSINLGVTRFAEVVRAGKLSGLRNANILVYEILSRAGGGAFGEALTHADALEKLCIPYPREEVTAAFLEGLARGTGRLPALQSLECPFNRSIRTQAAQSLSKLVRGGKVPSIKELTVNLAGIGQEGMQAFAATLSTPHASALRRLEVKFGGVGPADAAAEVELFSVALSSGYLRRLEKLSVGGLGVIDEVRALCVGLGSRKLTSLLTLRFVACRLGTEGGRALSEVLTAEKLPSLRTLEAGMTELTDEGVRALIEGWMSRDPPPLQCVNLGWNGLSAVLRMELEGGRVQRAVQEKEQNDADRREHKRRQNLRKKERNEEELLRCLQRVGNSPDSSLLCRLHHKVLLRDGDGVSETETTVLPPFIEWDTFPSSVDPLKGGQLQGRKGGARGPNKRLQIEGFYAVLRPVLCALRREKIKRGDMTPIRVVDFGGGSGNFSLALAFALRSECKFLIVDINAHALALAQERVRSAGLEETVSVLCAPVEAAHLCEPNGGREEKGGGKLKEPKETTLGDFDVGIGMHVCGVATDIAQLQSLRADAVFLLCSCCVGKVGTAIAKEREKKEGEASSQGREKEGGVVEPDTALDEKEKEEKGERETVLGVSHPRSLLLRQSLSPQEFAAIAAASDRLPSIQGEKNKKKTFISENGEAGEKEDPKVHRRCKTLVEADRNQAASEAPFHYATRLLRLHPTTCTPKNDLILGFPPRLADSLCSHLEFLPDTEEDVHAEAENGLVGRSGERQKVEKAEKSKPSPVDGKGDGAGGGGGGRMDSDAANRQEALRDTSVCCAFFIKRKERQCRLMPISEDSPFCSLHQPNQLEMVRKQTETKRQEHLKRVEKGETNEEEKEEEGDGSSPASSSAEPQSLSMGRVSSATTRMQNPLAQQHQVPVSPPDWLSVWEDPSLPVHIDIGCARGKMLLDLARKDKERGKEKGKGEERWNYLGIEIRAAAVDEANLVKQKEGLANVHFVATNFAVSADVLLSSLQKKQGCGPVRRVSILFPDPWLRSRHKKRRLVQPELARELCKLLPAGCALFVCSDRKELAEDMCEAIETGSEEARQDLGKGFVRRLLREQGGDPLEGTQRGDSEVCGAERRTGGVSGETGHECRERKWWGPDPLGMGIESERSLVCQMRHLDVWRALFDLVGEPTC
uniref:tRNA (guanine(46)-N(7))-methyltransferase n=1 Tax=Chromera velia CCMP2878 TaxID=1169474 RepID=A0A0G4IFW2_9ALVE|eukprot:Cvel_14126.t1-p1 / transcript=Cvel_14126.t1 / gene=Cvel_14126 / organism=Chromera_velia_CCMP2878 / gene_product=tRNA (guanine-N(7)-)-methyltransferase, putative / transcript_product=tRNA (guanine-N(7)-)-methyltransferase, putative / location=Cvel_scaffold995:2537-17456(+) / protein_length=1700 / sequence_SO=supercontig / SO=protein_coding / is_pseudo=false